MNKAQSITIALVWAIVSVHLAGCGNKFFDPTQIGRFRPTPAVNVILDSLGVAEETPVPYKNAEEPRPSDIVAVEDDYVFTSGDVIRIAIFELFQEGMTVVNDYVVTETGKISVPDVGIVQAAGLTETQLEEQIKQSLSPGILKAPAVSVTLLNSQQRTFSILGVGVPGPGRYLIPRYDFRLTDALATAGGPAQFNVSYIYVSRRQKSTQESPGVTKPEAGKLDLNRLDTVEPKQGGLQIFQPGRARPQLPQSITGKPVVSLPNPSESTAQPGIPKQGRELRSQSEREMLQIITPQVQRSWPESKKVLISSTEMVSNSDLDQATLPPGFYVPANRGRQVTSTRGASNPPLLGLTDRRTMDGYAAAMYTPSASAGLFGSSMTGEETTNNKLSGEIEWTFQDGKWVPIQVTPPKPPEPQAKEAEAGGRIEWIFEDGKWVPVQVGPPKPTKPVIKFEPEGPAVPLEEKLVAEELEWEKAVQARVIKIPAARLLAGDPRYNIVIRPGDTIHVPVDIIGEFCIMGNVNSRGYVNITGRPMTLKMAIAAAGGLGSLAWPKRCEVIRRIGENKEEIVMVDLDKISNGEQPDFFIKPNDLINVGSHATARWRAILRNAFRATYGFGFVYDRNFGDADYGKGFRLPHWF
jgi:polysaccharide export outer membrane protein